MENGLPCDDCGGPTYILWHIDQLLEQNTRQREHLLAIRKRVIETPNADIARIEMERRFNDESG